MIEVNLYVIVVWNGFFVFGLVICLNGILYNLFVPQLIFGTLQLMDVSHVLEESFLALLYRRGYVTSKPLGLGIRDIT